MRHCRITVALYHRRQGVQSHFTGKPTKKYILQAREKTDCFAVKKRIKHLYRVEAGGQSESLNIGEEVLVIEIEWSFCFWRLCPFTAC